MPYKPWKSQGDTLPLSSYTSIIDSLDLKPKKTGTLGLKLYFPSMENHVTVSIDSSFSIGRKHPDNQENPDIDLLHYGAVECGISRIHAVVVGIEGQYYIKDMGSTNGTFVNHQRIPPFQMYPLRSDDHLRLGHMVVGVR